MAIIIIFHHSHINVLKSRRRMFKKVLFTELIYTVDEQNTHSHIIPMLIVHGPVLFVFFFWCCWKINQGLSMLVKKQVNKDIL